MFKIWQSQKGAFFGLDARIALAIFAGLSVVAGAAITLNLSSVSAGALADELKQFSISIEGIHQDLKADIHSVLRDRTDEAAFAALFDIERLKVSGRSRSRWLGPYVEYRDIQHPKYGTMRISKAGEPFTQNCLLSRICYLWLNMNAVSYPVVEHVNRIFDGENETSPDKEGRVQWNGEGRTVHLYFRATKSLNRR